MRIERAFFRIGTIEETVTLESITQHKDYQTIKGNLYCTTPNCSCKLIYIPKGAKVAYFKKWKGYHHIVTCFYYKDTEKSATS